MKTCKLCNKNAADKSGSHIVPHFLLKRIENIEGKTGRDYEIGFSIEKLKSTSYFGRSVQPERLEETYGELTDEDIANNKHPLIVDNFFCTDCEDRLAIIESEYSKTISSIGEIEYESGVGTIIGIIFWGSILWRMSINGKSGVKLTSEQNELLREILDSFLPKNIEELNEKAFAESDLVIPITYRLLRCNDCKSEKAKFLLFHPLFYNSLCLFIDEYILAYSLNGKYDEFKNTNCFGINKLIIEAPINRIGNKEVIKPFSNYMFNELKSRIVYKVKDEYIEGLNEIFDEVHRVIGGKGKRMPDEIKQEIMAEIILGEKKIGRKYTQEEIKKSIHKVLLRYMQ